MRQGMLAGNSQSYRPTALPGGSSLIRLGILILRIINFGFENFISREVSRLDTIVHAECKQWGCLFAVLVEVKQGKRVSNVSNLNFEYF